MHHNKIASHLGNLLCMLGKLLRVNHGRCHGEILLKRMLSCDLFAVANLLVIVCYSPRSAIFNRITEKVVNRFEINYIGQ